MSLGDGLKLPVDTFKLCPESPAYTPTGGAWGWGSAGDNSRESSVRQNNGLLKSPTSKALESVTKLPYMAEALCRCDSIRALEMGRVSQIIQLGPI